MIDLVDKLPGGILTFGDDGLIVSANPTLAAIVGRQREELPQKHVETILTVPSRIFYYTHLLPLLKLQGRLDEVYISLRSLGGEEVPVLLNASRTDVDGNTLNCCVLMPMHRRNQFEDEILNAKRAAEIANEEKTRVLGSLREAHRELERQKEELRRSNAELQNLRMSLEQRVEARTAELNAAIGELQGLNYSIAHDLRAPLRAMVATSAILEAEAPQLTSEYVQLLRRQKVNALALSSLVDDLLRLSRLGAQPILRQPIDVSALAREIAPVVIEHYGRGDIRVEIQDGLEVEADRTMLQLVLQNLIDNAVKYSPGGGTITIGTVRVRDISPFFVRDEGIGIDPAYFERIFEPFQRLHRSTEFPGNGIGLANVLRIVRRHGGQVWVESELGQGATVFFTLSGGSTGPTAPANASVRRPDQSESRGQMQST